MKVVKTTVEPPEPLKENEKQIELISGSSSYRGRLNVKFAILIIKSY